MFISAKAFFKDNTQNNVRLLVRAETQLPQEFAKRYRKNVVKITPMKSGRLRRSIITQSLGNTAQVSWRAPYARAQNEGGHTDKTVHFVPAKGFGAGERGYMARPGWHHRYRNYTTAGTGPRFASIAFKATKAEMPAVYRELGLTT